MVGGNTNMGCTVLQQLNGGGEYANGAGKWWWL
jgi:hypothetical protein